MNQFKFGDAWGEGTWGSALQAELGLVASGTKALGDSEVLSKLSVADLVKAAAEGGFTVTLTPTPKG